MLPMFTSPLVSDQPGGVALTEVTNSLYPTSPERSTSINEKIYLWGKG